jgi:hypothetical protein
MSDDNTLDDLVEELLFANERGDASTLARLIAIHPEYEHQLTAYAVADAGLSAPLQPAQRDAAATLDTAELRDRALAAALGRDAAESAPALTGLIARASAIGIDARQLAAATDLPRDVLLKLDRRLVTFASVPRRCLAALADALQTNVDAVQSFLAGGPGTRVAAFNYAAKPPIPDQQETFAAALAASALATPEQQAAWQQALHDDGLA